MAKTSEEEKKVKTPETDEKVTDETETQETETQETEIQETETEEVTEEVTKEKDLEETEETEETSEKAEEEEGAKADAKEDSKDKKDGFFAKKKKKDKRDEQIEELNDKLRRQMAEFDNFRKRSEKEKTQMFDMGARTIIEKVLPIVDNFERGLSAVPEEQKEDAFVVGMDKVYKQLMQEFDSIGVKPIEAVGEEFDPELHNAVMQVESEEYEPGVIAQELQKGYMYKDTVVRHSMVAVVKE